MTMATVSEALESGNIDFSFGTQSNYEEQYHVHDASSREDALNAVAASLVPRQYIEISGRVLILDRISVKPVSDDSVGLYKATATWVSPERAQNRGNQRTDPGFPPEFTPGGGIEDPDTWVPGTQFDIAAEQETQYWSRTDQVSGYGTPEHNHDLQGAINFDGENVKGVPVYSPKPTWSEEFTRKNWFVPAKLKLLANYVATVNVEAYQGFDAGELLITSINGSFTTKDEFKYRVTYAYSPNKENIKFGEGTESYTVPAKPGWHYLWTRYEKVVIESINLIIPRPVASYVHGIYPASDFSKLKTL